MWQRVIAGAGLLCASCAAAAALAKRMRRRRRRRLRQESQHTAVQALEAQLLRAREELQHEQKKRAADRAGRVKAEQELSQLRLRLAQQAPAAGDQQQQQHQHGAAPAVYPFRPIGTVRSCFTQRNGTPRQPHLVEAARAVVDLAPGVHADCLEGLAENFSHVWLIYVFHQNTDLGKNLAAATSGPASSSGFKAKVAVPRLNGRRLGVFATRTPHRPAPIGLSLAKVVAVRGRQLVVGGVDLVNGTPVLDIKPLVPFSDCPLGAMAPPWVAAEAQDEPLRLGGVSVGEEARRQLREAWRRVRATSLYATADEFTVLVEQVLARDIRSLHQRRTRPSTAAPAPASTQPTGVAEAAAEAEAEPGVGPPACGEDQMVYRVVLEGVDVTYTLEEGGRVVVRGASVWGNGGDADGVLAGHGGAAASGAG